jgi:uncharacterized protein YacL
MFQLVRFLLVISGTVAGVGVGYGVTAQYGNFLETENAEIKLAALLGCIGYLFCSMAGRELEMYLQAKIDSTNSLELAWGALGLLLGVIFGNLFFIPVYFILYKGYGDVHFENKYFDSLVGFFHLVVPIFSNLLFGYLGMAIVHRYRSATLRSRSGTCAVLPKIMDTSAIIDGRFADLIKLGFLEGQILVPRYVINELQFLADGADAMKRGKGRQGLDLLNTLHKQYPDILVITEKDFPKVHEVDAKLVEQAKSDDAILFTQDFNLKRVAELQDIKVLNLNDLVNALKPIVLSGEDIEVQIIKPGKDSQQGVGYLPDGTMVVVEDGGGHIGKKVSTTVHNILQTAAGRMIFTRISGAKRS